MDDSSNAIAARVWRHLQAETREMGFAWRPTLVVVWVSLVLLLPEYHKGIWFNDLLRTAGGDAFFHFCRTSQINLKFVLRVVVPIAFLVAMRERLGGYGLGLGKVKTGLKLCLCFYVLYIPCFIVLFMNAGFQAHYGGIVKHIDSIPAFFMKQVIPIAVLALRTEFLYRGFLLFGVKRHYGAWAGILVQIIPYVLMHGHKAPMEAFGSLPVGLALAYLAVKTESIWYGAILHGSIALLFNALILILHYWGG